MIVYRHKIWVQNLKRSFADGDFENIKMVAMFLATFAIVSFFSVRILDTLNQGMEAEQRTQKIQGQLAQLEKENELLQSQKDIAISDSEIEAQYRALGNKKPGEQIYIVDKKDGSQAQKSQLPSTSEPAITSSKPKSNWEEWFLLIFKN